MKTQRTDAGGIEVCQFARLQMPAAAWRGLLCVSREFRLRLGVRSAWSEKLVVVGSGLKQGRLHMRRAIQGWSFIPAHAAGKILVGACAATC